MDKKIAGLLGAAAALTSMTSATQAAPAQKTELAPATSYRDLLNPISNAIPVARGSCSTFRRELRYVEGHAPSCP